MLEKQNKTRYRYPTPNEMLDGGNDIVPETLRLFTEGVICKGKKGDVGKYTRTCRVLGEAIIAAARPRSFVSPLQVVLPSASLSLHS